MAWLQLPFLLPGALSGTGFSCRHLPSLVVMGTTFVLFRPEGCTCHPGFQRQQLAAIVGVIWGSPMRSSVAWSGELCYCQLSKSVQRLLVRKLQFHPPMAPKSMVFMMYNFLLFGLCSSIVNEVGFAWNSEPESYNNLWWIVTWQDSWQREKWLGHLRLFCIQRYLD
jgi:hypothetical protein